MTKEERDEIVAKALKKKSRVKKARRPEPQPDPVVEIGKSAKKESVKKEK